jgi:hypothetical protein
MHSNQLTYRVDIVASFPIDAKVIRWFNETIGCKDRDWTVEYAERNYMPYVLVRTEYQKEMFKNRWERYCYSWLSEHQQYRVA